jgi:hypothetical protein
MYTAIIDICKGHTVLGADISEVHKGIGGSDVSRT